MPYGLHPLGRAQYGLRLEPVDATVLVCADVSVFPAEVAVETFPAEVAVETFPAEVAVETFPAEVAVETFPAEVAVDVIVCE